MKVFIIQNKKELRRMITNPVVMTALKRQSDKNCWCCFDNFIIVIQ